MKPAHDTSTSPAVPAPNRLRAALFMVLALGAGTTAGFAPWSWLHELAQLLADVFMGLLRMISLPMIFLAIVSTLSGMEGGFARARRMGLRVLGYTLLTTFLAASVALGLFLLLDPVAAARGNLPEIAGMLPETVTGGSDGWTAADIRKSFLRLIPSNGFQPFLEGNVLGVFFLAVICSVAILHVREDARKTLHDVFSALYAVIMKLAAGIVLVMPLALAAFTTLLVRDMRVDGLHAKSFALYLTCVVAANCIQGMVVLPLILKLRGIPVMATFRAMAPALSLAFFSRSSAAAMPTAIQCAEHRLGTSHGVTRFSFPLCTTMNMNGCAAFILTTVLFISMMNGRQFSLAEMVMWVFLASISALGNAGIPMGCFALSGALLATLGVPVYLMGAILPFYSLIDMFESALNLWSDSCVTVMVDRDFRRPGGPVSS